MSITQSGSNENLIQFTANGDLAICGLPVYTLPAVDAYTLSRVSQRTAL